MSYFVVSYLGLFALVLVLAPMLWHVFKENKDLKSYLHHARHEVVATIQQAEHYRLACEHASDGLIIQDMDGRIIWCNPAYCKLHRTTADKILGCNPLEFALPPDEAMTPEQIARTRFDITEGALQLCHNQNADGGLFWNQISITFRKLADGRERAIAVCRDVTVQIEQQNQMRDIGARLEHEASHDNLTGIPNRAAFLSFINDALHTKGDDLVGLLHIDLDNFKAVNDTHGHTAGDAVLSNTADTLRTNIRDCDLVARVGGDEFVIVCPQVGDLAFLSTLSNRLVKAISEPFEWSNRLLKIEASIGAALSSTSGADVEELLIKSDFALYEAKRAGRNQAVLYDNSLREQHAFQNRREHELAEAIDAGKLDYYFQPTLCLKTRKVVGMEALVRWNHPIEGLLAPNDFLPMVKNLGLLGALDICAMEAALAEKRKLNLAGFETIGIAFNASPQLLAHPQFVDRLVWGVEAGGIERNQVTIEVLETTNFGSATETASHAAIIRDLRQAGFCVHLDDFGIGFAGLSHLAALDVSGVKIDRGLVVDMLTDTTSRKIVCKIIELSNDLGLTVIAEGVEDHKTATALQVMGCNVVQGYWLSKPLPPYELLDWLHMQDKHPHRLHA